MEPIYDINTYEPRKGIGYLVNRVRTELLAALDRELAADADLAPLEVTAAQYLVLTHLAAGDLESTSQLCKQVSYDPGAMTRMLDRLEANGLVRRSRCPYDRRLVNLVLTSEGEAAVPKMRAVSVKVLNRFLGGFTQEEMQVFEGFLNRMIANG